MSIKERFDKAATSTPPPSDASDAHIGRTLDGRYRILSLIAEGGQGRVYLARHLLIKREVAIKILSPMMASDANLVDRFLSEGRAAGTLGHPNVVESIDMGITSEGAPYLVLELLRGATLSAELRRAGKLSVGRAAYIGAQIASGLAAAHAQGIVHRDLKSDNVFLCSNEKVGDHVKILDFGVSRFIGKGATHQGQVFGTPEYMAPEQIRDPGNVDAHADVYALGVVAYEMMSGATPFDGEPFPEILSVVVNTVPPSLALVVPDAPPKLVTTVDAALAKSPRSRPSLEELEACFHRFAEEPPRRALGSIPDSGPSLPSASRSRSGTLRVSPASQDIAPARIAPERNRSSSTRFVVGLALAFALVAGAVLWTRVSSRGAVSAIDSAPTASALAVAEPHAPPSFVGATASPAEDEASRDVAFAITSSAPDAKVIFRGSTYALPYTASVARGSEPETVVVSAPRYQGSRIQMRFDRPVSLRVNLPPGAGTKDATTAEIESFSAAAPSLPATANAVNMPRGPLRPAATGTHEALPDAPTAPANAASRPAPVTAASRPALVTAEPVPPPPPPATTPPVVAAPAPTVGTIDSRAVNATVRSHGAEIRDCFDRAKLRNAEVRGRVTVGATISGTGAVQAAAVTLSSANDPRLESCVVGAFRSWSFPPPSGALPAPLTYTFTFE